MNFFNCNSYFEIARNYLLHVDVHYRPETAFGVNYQEALNITKSLKEVTSRISFTNRGIRNSIVHFGTQHIFFGSNRFQLPHASNKSVVTWYHVSPKDRNIDRIEQANEHVNIWHTSCSITEAQLISFGIPQNKIVVIPIGINLEDFSPFRPNERISFRQKLGIPRNSIVIGSFQKDGEGWGKGLEPKLIKGPDVFCDVVEILAKRYKNIFVLLTGPARGYVKNRLKKAKIPFIAHYLKEPKDVSKYYSAIDFYIIASRIEGGPRSILESFSTGVPVVTTRVGLANDIIVHKHNGMLCNVEDVEALVDCASMLIEDKTLYKHVIRNAFSIIGSFSYDEIASEHYRKIYKPLMVNR